MRIRDRDARGCTATGGLARGVKCWQSHSEEAKLLERPENDDGAAGRPHKYDHDPDDVPEQDLRRRRVPVQRRVLVREDRPEQHLHARTDNRRPPPNIYMYIYMY